MYMPAEALFPSLLKVAQDDNIIKSTELKFIPEIDNVMVQECIDINEEYGDVKDPKMLTMIVIFCGVAAASAVWSYHYDYENYVKNGIYDSVESAEEDIFDYSIKYYKSDEIIRSIHKVWTDFNNQIVKKFFDKADKEQHMQFCIALFMLGMTLGMEKCGL